MVHPVWPLKCCQGSMTNEAAIENRQVSSSGSPAESSASPARRISKGILAGLAGALAMNLANHRGSAAGHGAQTYKPAGPPGTKDAALDPVEKALPALEPYPGLL